MTHPKLHYFPAPGRAAAIRDAFRLGGVSFEDAHVGRDEFRRMKTENELPFGSLPAIDIGGQRPMRIAQSNAILRYAGKLSGLYPTDVIDALRVDELVDFAEDINQSLAPSLMERDMEKKLAMRQKLVDEKVPGWFSALAARLAQNGDAGHFVGTSLTIADLKLFHLLDGFTTGGLDGIPKTILDGYPTLVAWHASVRAERDAKLQAS